MMEADTIATPTELIHKLYQADAPLDGAPLMQTARTTETAPKIICDVKTENPSAGMKLQLMSSLYN
jgi:hypothetical protein